jgi:hypothetical protein
MIDPRHDKRIPSGRRLAAALRGVLAAMRVAAHAAVARGRVPDLAGYERAIVSAVLPIIYHEYHLGREQAARNLRRRLNAKSVDVAVRKAGANGIVAGAQDRRGLGELPGGPDDPAGASPAVGRSLRADPTPAGGVAPGRDAGRHPGGVHARPLRMPPVVKAGYPFGHSAPGPSHPPGLSVPGLSFAPDLLRDAVPRQVQQLVLSLAGSITDGIRQDVRDRLEQGLREGVSNSAIADSLGDLFSPRRAMTIAMSESSRAMHAGSVSYLQEVEQQTGLQAYLVWMTSADGCDACLALDGKRVKLGEPFFVHAKGNPAYRVVAHPPLHPRCGCATYEELLDKPADRRVRRS